MPTQTEEQRQSAFTAAGLNQGQQASVTSGTQFDPATPLSTTNLTPTQAPVIPPPLTSRDFSSFASASIESLLADFNKPTAEETAGGDLQSRILESLGTIGTERSRQQTLEQEAGLPEQRKELQAVINQLQGLQKEAIAIPLQIQQEFAGRGATRAGVAPIETGRLRENAIKSLSLAAIGQTLQGNISLAQSTIKDALDAEFEPERQKLATLQQLYTFNKDALERKDKKKAEALRIKLTERERILNEQRADKEYSSNLMLEASKFGAPADVLEQMRNSTPDVAIALGAKYFGEDFKRKAEQQAFENGIALRSLAIQESNARLAQRKSLLEAALLGDRDAINQLGYDPRDVPLSEEDVRNYEDQKATFERDLNITNRILSNDIGIKSTAGLFKGTFLGTVGGPAAAAYAKQKTNDFIADAQYVLKNLTFGKIKELNDQGIKLTPISEKELKAMGEAANVLVSAANFDEAGNLVDFKVSEDRVREQFKLVSEHYQNAIDDININMVLSPEERRAIIGL